MRNEELPITPSVLKWARERAGISLVDAEKSFKKIREWEAASSAPTYPQLESLAEALKVPVAVFFFPEPPKVPQVEETFRTLPEAEIELLPTKIRLLLRKAKALQINLAELNNHQNTSARLITKELRIPLSSEIAHAAESVRKYLGISLEQQISWKDTEQALAEWRSIILNNGIYIFKDAFRNEEFSGFCLYDDKFPIIYLNNSSSKSRQIFTIFHELAHLIFHTSGVDTAHDSYVDNLKNDAKKIEIFCNKFAAEFLVPEKHLAGDLKGKKPTRELAHELAEKYKVSRESIYRRFLDKNLISEQEYNSASHEWRMQRNKDAGGGNPYWTKLSYLGREYVSLALSRYWQNRISEYETSEYLDIKPKNLAVLEDYYARGTS